VAGLAILLGLVGLPELVRAALIEAFEADGASMEPSIFSTERFAMSKTACGLLLPGGRQQVLSWSTPRLGG
jgi:hypothetical protein